MELSVQEKSPVCDITLEQVVAAYHKCRKNKRNTDSQLEFEMNAEENLFTLYQELLNGEYVIGRSICFVVTSPNVREIWAASFRDRIVQHLIYDIISPQYNKSFIYDSCACIPEKGTKFAMERLDTHLRRCSDNWREETFYLKMDISNFFVSIDKDVVWEIMKPVLDGRHDEWVVDMTKFLLFHDPRKNPIFNSDEHEREKVESRKRLELCDENKGLPIGNILSQFIANVVMDVLDKFVKHDLKVKHYVRYVDDFILIHQDKEFLRKCIRDITEVLRVINLRPNPRKTILQRIDRGVSFVGSVTFPFNQVPHPKTLKRLYSVIDGSTEKESYNSILGWMGQTNSYNERLKLLRLALRNGKSIKFPISHL